jgi:hypothetical protein
MKVETRTTEERLDELRAAYERLYDRFDEVRGMLKASASPAIQEHPDLVEAIAKITRRGFTVNQLEDSLLNIFTPARRS